MCLNSWHSLTVRFISTTKLSNHCYQKRGDFQRVGNSVLMCTYTRISVCMCRPLCIMYMQASIYMYVQLPYGPSTSVVNIWVLLISLAFTVSSHLAWGWAWARAELIINQLSSACVHGLRNILHQILRARMQLCLRRIMGLKFSGARARDYRLALFEFHSDLSLHSVDVIFINYRYFKSCLLSILLFF